MLYGGSVTVIYGFITCFVFGAGMALSMARFVFASTSCSAVLPPPPPPQLSRGLALSPTLVISEALTATSIANHSFILVPRSSGPRSAARTG